MRIDAHVHAFPSVGENIAAAAGRALGPKAAKAVTNYAAPKAKAVADRLVGLLSPVLPEGPLLDIERVAAVKEKAGRVHGVIESAGSIALLAPVMLGGTVAGLLASMDRHGITRSIVIGSRGVASNDWLLGEAMRAGGDRFIPVATLPELGESASPDQWREAYEDLARAGARGFKIHPNWDGVGATHPAVRAMFEVADAHGQFIIVHTGCFHVVGYKSMGGVDLASFERWFQAFPRVRVCFAHMNRDRPVEAWDLMKRYEQLFADTSWQTTASIARAIDAVGSDRIMLGSDWPLLHLELQGDALERVQKAASGAALEDLVSASALRFIGRVLAHESRKG